MKLPTGIGNISINGLTYKNAEMVLIFFVINPKTSYAHIKKTKPKSTQSKNKCIINLN